MLSQLNQVELDEVLLDRLAGLDEESLARVLGNRADVLEPPWPRRLADAALRMADPGSVELAMRRLTRPGLQLLRAIRLVVTLGGDAAIDEVAHWLGADADDVTPVLAQLTDRVLAWPQSGGRVRTPPSHDVVGVDFVGLGPSITEYLPQRNVQDLKAMCSALGIGGGGRKDEIIDRMLAFLRGPANLTGLLADAPDGTEELLAEFAWHGPERACFPGDGYYPRQERVESPARWASKRGLLWRGYDGTAVMPLEVGLALRGPDYRLPFEPRPPVPAVMPVSAEQVSSAGSTAALRMVDRVCAVLDHAVAQPIPLLKSGRVGARAVKTLAKATGSTVEETRLAVELGIAMLLLAPVEVEPEPVNRRRGRGSRKPAEPVPPPGLVPSERLALWRESGPADRLRMTLATWWALPIAPFADEQVVRSVLGDDPSAAFTHVRQLAVRLVAELPADTGVADEVSLADLVGWHAPTIHPDLRGTLVGSALVESALLGVTAFGAAGEVAHALLAATGWPGGPADRSHPDLVRVTDQLVTQARTTALFGADLTAVVTGAPDAALAGLLDRVADREATGAASTWRFSPASVRRALDNGTAAAALLGDLRAVAGKPLPQPLEYLVNDVARRHGEVGVLAVNSVIVGAEALLTEIAAHRKLSSLGLRAVAPTVLVAGGGADATLAALRTAGYAPVLRDGDGTVTVEPPERTGMSLPIEDLSELAPPVARDPHEHALRLLRAQPRSGRPVMPRGALLDMLHREQGERLTPDWMRLAWQLESGLPTRVNYLEPDGERRELVISDVEPHDDTIDVWCAEFAEYRRLELARLSPAGAKWRS
jgi:hypothetical protein